MRSKGTGIVHDRDSIYRYIVDYKTQNDGLAPTTRELQTQFQITSSSLVRYILHDLQTAGLILVSSDARSIKVVGGQWRMNA